MGGVCVCVSILILVLIYIKLNNNGSKSKKTIINENQTLIHPVVTKERSFSARINLPVSVDKSVCIGEFVLFNEWEI